MRRYLPRLAMFASLALAVTACGSTTEARTGGWTHASTPPAGGAAQPAVAAAQASPGQAEKITIEAFDLGFKPSMPTVPAAGTYQVEFKNTGSTLHDVTFADGTKISAEGGNERDRHGHGPGSWTCLPVLDPRPRRCRDEGRGHGRGSGTGRHARPCRRRDVDGARR